MRSVPVCENHLAEFYEAVKIGDLPLMEKEERVLTASEKCVACTYVFKTRGTVRDSLENYLIAEGLSINKNNSNKTLQSEIFYWCLRLSVLLSIFALYFYLLSFFKSYFFHSTTFGIIEIILIGLLAIGSFIFIDDRILE